MKPWRNTSWNETASPQFLKFNQSCVPWWPDSLPVTTSPVCVSTGASRIRPVQGSTDGGRVGTVGSSTDGANFGTVGSPSDRAVWL